MLRGINRRRAWQTTALSLVSVILTLWMLPPAAVAQGEADELPDAAHVVAAYMTARSWLDAFDTPDTEVPESHMTVKNARAVCVVLRQAGRVVGTGIDDQGDDLMVRRAMGRALSEMQSEEALRTMPADLLPTVGRRVVLEMEFASEVQPLIGLTFDDLASRVRPGLDGVALRRGEHWSFRFPSQMRAQNRCGPDDIAQSFTSMLIDMKVSLGSGEWADVRTRESVSAYRFATTHLAQAEADALPFATVRGGRVVPQSAVNRESLASFAEDLVEHILAREWIRLQDGVPVQEPLGLRGTYEPARDQYSPLIASPFEQALTSYALSRYVKSPGVDPERAGRAAAFAERLLAYLAEQVPGNEPDPVGDVGAAAMIVCASFELLQTRPRPSVQGLVRNAITRVRDAFDADRSDFRSLLAEDGTAIPLGADTKALVVMAMARLLAIQPDTIAAPTVRAALDRAWEGVNEWQQVSLLPWMGWAELEYAQATGEEAGLARFDRIRSLLDGVQVTSGGPAQPDLWGGYELSGNLGKSVTAQGLRPASWLARWRLSGVGNDQSGGIDTGLEGLASFARFLMQLAVTDADTWAYRNPNRTLGGVRESVWDSNQAVPAQSLGLIFVCDILRGKGLFGP